MTVSNTGPGSATGWPDVGLAIVAFAREDIERFTVAVMVVAAAFTGSIWFLYPRVTKGLRKGYLQVRLSRRKYELPEGEEPDDD